MVEKADVFLMLHDKVEIALEILDQLSDKYPGKYIKQALHHNINHGKDLKANLLKTNLFLFVRVDS